VKKKVKKNEEEKTVEDDPKVVDKVVPGENHDAEERVEKDVPVVDKKKKKKGDSQLLIKAESKIINSTNGVGFDRKKAVKQA
jgi:hypothetical protein